MNHAADKCPCREDHGGQDGQTCPRWEDGAIDDGKSRTEDARGEATVSCGRAGGEHEGYFGHSQLEPSMLLQRTCRKPAPTKSIPGGPAHTV